MFHNYPRLIFFRRGNYGTTFLTILHFIAWNRFHSSKIHYLFVFTSQANKSLLNWVVLILIEQNILKTQNQDFPPSKIVTTKLSGIDFNRAKYFKNAKSRFSTKQDWICHNLTEMIGEIDFIIVLVVYRSTFKVVLTIFRIF